METGGPITVTERGAAGRGRADGFTLFRRWWLPQLRLTRAALCVIIRVDASTATDLTQLFLLPVLHLFLVCLQAKPLVASGKQH